MSSEKSKKGIKAKRKRRTRFLQATGGNGRLTETWLWLAKSDCRGGALQTPGAAALCFEQIARSPRATHSSRKFGRHKAQRTTVTASYPRGPSWFPLSFLARRVPLVLFFLSAALVLASSSICAPPPPPSASQFLYYLPFAPLCGYCPFLFSLY